jgi:hypothetical protein
MVFKTSQINPMKTFTAIAEAENDPDTQLYVGYIPGFPGAHSQGERMSCRKICVR